MNVYIIGNKMFFSSKTRIRKLKEYLKKLDNPRELKNIKSKDYLKDGYGFTITYKKPDYYVELLTEKQAKREELRLKLREKINNTGHNSRKKFHKLMKVEKKVDKKLFKKYQMAIRTNLKGFEIPPPSEAIENTTKYIQMITMLSSDMFNKPQTKDLYNYFNALSEYLKIPKYQPTDNKINTKNIKDETDTEEENQKVNL